MRFSMRLNNVVIFKSRGALPMTGIPILFGSREGINCISFLLGGDELYLLFAWRRRVVTQLGVNYADARAAVEAIALAEISGSESYRSPLLSGSLKTTRDDKLLLELAKRGYDLESIRKKKTTAEIVKIAV